MCLWHYLKWQFIPTCIRTSVRNLFGKTLQSSYSPARWLFPTLWTSLSRTLVRVSSAAPHVHSPVDIMMCALHQGLTLHLLTAQLHFTSSTTASDAGATSDTVGMHVPSSSSSCHPSPTWSSIVGSATVLCPNVRLIVC